MLRAPSAGHQIGQLGDGGDCRGDSRPSAEEIPEDIAEEIAEEIQRRCRRDFTLFASSQLSEGQQFSAVDCGRAGVAAPPPPHEELFCTPTLQGNADV